MRLTLEGSTAMSSQPNPAPILVVDDDEVLLQVLSRVLGHEGHTVLQATGTSQALQLAEQLPPRLALVDLCLTDGDGVDLAGRLHARQPDLPLILMTAYPLRLREYPKLRDQFWRVLNKPLDLQALRRAVNDALRDCPALEAPTSLSPHPEGTSPANPHPAEPAQPAAAADASPARRSPLAWLASAGVVLLVLGVVVAFVLIVAGVPLPGLFAAAGEPSMVAPAAVGVQRVEGVPHTILVHEEARDALGIRQNKVDRAAVARVPTETRPLVLSGSTAFDPALLTRIRIRFTPAEVVKIAQVPDELARDQGRHTEYRELRSGDQVQKGDLIAVVYSVDVGQKKNDLIDALVQLKLDEKIHDEAMKSTGAVPPVFMWSALRAVEGDRNAVARAESTLKTWNIPQEDIDAVYKEAEEINKRHGKRDKSKEDQWPRVELRAPEDGTIVERNVSLHEVVVDNTLNLFQIAKVDRLTAVANASEDDLPALLKLRTDQRRWTVRTVGAPDQGISGPIDEISYLIDVNQHNAVVKGNIDNPKGHLRAGQFISASIDLPPPDGVVEIPTTALVDQGNQCLVFVQPDPNQPRYTLRRVQVTHRFDKTVYVRSDLSAAEMTLTNEEKEEGLLPRQPLKPGERVLTSGVLVLRKELAAQESDTSPTR
jgi:cobalt-zinc-cadmium efflux system membrane fusion protein